MANPFLFEDVADYSESSKGFNPFLCGGDEPPELENPFLTSMSTAPGTNPFADYTWDEPTGNNPGLLTPPAITNINDPENDFVVSSDDEVSKPRRPPPPRPSVPKETHDLILSVTGALKATSDDLLDRIPPTRAPSPTVFADLHSPSPTPDMFGSEESFMPGLSYSQQVQPQQPQPPPQPARPPPPRPPARPAPPALKPTPKVESQPQPEIDLFGTPSAPQPKSTDAILNLYSQPKPSQAAPDWMSDDVEPPLQEAVILSELGSSFLPDNASDSSSIASIITPVTSGIPVTQNQSQADPKMFSPETSVINQIKEPTSDNVSQPTVHDMPDVAQLESVEESAAVNDALKLEPAQPKPSSVFAVTPPEERPPLFPEPELDDEPSNQTQNSLIFEKEELSNQICNGEVLPATQVGDHEIMVDGPPATIESQIFGVPDCQESASQLFGVEPPQSEPKLFGVGPSEHDDSPQMFGVERSERDIAPQMFGVPPAEEPVSQLFGVGRPTQDATPQAGNIGYVEAAPNIFGVGSAAFTQPSQEVDAFDVFSAKFEEVSHTQSHDAFDAFGGSAPSSRKAVADAWGAGAGSGSVDQSGFGGDSFDAFLSMQPPPAAQLQPSSRMGRTESADSEEGGFSVFIKPREGESYTRPISGQLPTLAPPPKSPAYTDADPRFNPFDQNGQIPALPLQEGFPLPPLNESEPYEGGFKRTDSQETPPTPLFDEDVSQPLEEFPRIHYVGEGWEMQLRHPNKKKITGQRFWKKIFVKLVYQGDNPVLQLFNLKDDKDPFQELPLQACYSVSEISAQQYDQFGKIFTVKLQYIFYKERPGVRPGQVTKAERITTKLSQFAAYAIQGDYQGVKEFGSDLKKLGLPVEHAPQVSQLLKLGCMSFEDLKQFSVTIEECLFRMPVHRDRALTYKMEEVQVTVVDEMYVEQDAYGHVEKQIARVRLFLIAFLSGMPDVELGVNDLWRQGKEVVGRHDIIPVVTEEWIRLEGVEFHSCVQLDEYDNTRTIKFKPPDACYIELMRFRIRPPKNRELPLQLKAVMCVTGNRVELRADVLVPGFTSRKLGQIPCEDVMIRFPIPECWIYMFRVEKHFRYGSVKSAHRRTGKIKGIERFLGAVENMEPSLMEVTSGQAKYEHQHRAIVWRMPRLPKEGQGAYTTHNLVCRMQLTSYDQIPDNLADYAYVEFTMPATTASHTTVRSVSLVDSPSDDPPEKYVRQLARMEYRVGIEHTQGQEMASYAAATITKPAPAAAPAAAEGAKPPPAPDSDSDSSG